MSSSISHPSHFQEHQNQLPHRFHHNMHYIRPAIFAWKEVTWNDIYIYFSKIKLKKLGYALQICMGRIQLKCNKIKIASPIKT